MACGRLRNLWWSGRFRNARLEGAFGIDVESLRRYKNLQRTTQNLRDYMGDLKLVLTGPGETAAAVAMHSNRGSNGFDELVADARKAGRIAGVARTQVEQGSARNPKACRLTDRCREPRRRAMGIDSSTREGWPRMSYSRGKGLSHPPAGTPDGIPEVLRCRFWNG
jgi:hypothetical protein